MGGYGNLFSRFSESRRGKCHRSYLRSKGISQIAITRGNLPIDFENNGIQGKVNVPPIQAIDTLGAGDVFHGAFCYFFLQHQNFALALEEASWIAAESCLYVGARSWMKPH